MASLSSSARSIANRSVADRQSASAESFCATFSMVTPSIWRVLPAAGAPLASGWLDASKALSRQLPHQAKPTTSSRIPMAAGVEDQ